ncbi:MAG: elongator complex protein 3 [Caulobacteraceae bacterium]
MSKRHYIIPIFVPHKGCPHDCVFCNQKKITGQLDEVTSTDVRNKVEEFLLTIPKENSCIEIAFYGGSFTAIPLEYQKELLEAAFDYIEKGDIESIRVSTRPDYINDTVLMNLKQYGVKIVELGVQSMDEKVLELSNRGHTAIDVVRAVKLLKSYGFTVGVQMMIGLPGDTFEKSLETAKRLAELKPDIARIYPTLVITNTYMEEMYRNGIYRPLTLEEAVVLSKSLLAVFERNGVNVIRIGLQPTENILMGKDVVAGPFHPSLRQLVEAQVYRDMLEMLLGRLEAPRKEITIEVNPKRISELVGQRKSNIEYIKRKFFIDKIEIIQNNHVEEDTLVLYTDEISIKMSEKDYYSIEA